jgi:hypothetical protein
MSSADRSATRSNRNQFESNDGKWVSSNNMYAVVFIFNVLMEPDWW